MRIWYVFDYNKRKCWTKQRDIWIGNIVFYKKNLGSCEIFDRKFPCTDPFRGKYASIKRKFVLLCFQFEKVISFHDWYDIKNLYQRLYVWHEMACTTQYGQCQSTFSVLNQVAHMVQVGVRTFCHSSTHYRRDHFSILELVSSKL